MNHKCDIEVAKRSYDYLIEVFGSILNVCKHTEISRNTIYQWRNGDSAPSAYHLQYLTQLGADPKYLLTGKRSITMSTCKATMILGKKDICKDCIKADVCKHKANLDKDPIIEMSIEQCEHFKDHSKFIELPCKVGDTVYFIDYSIIVPAVAKYFETNDHGWCVCCDVQPISTLTFRFDEFGKTVFLTKEEAEQALNKNNIKEK